MGIDRQPLPLPLQSSCSPVGLNPLTGGHRGGGTKKGVGGEGAPGKDRAPMTTRGAQRWAGRQPLDLKADKRQAGAHQEPWRGPLLGLPKLPELLISTLQFALPTFPRSSSAGMNIRTSTSK